MAVATAADVSKRVGRPLTPNEILQVEGYLEDAEAEIVRLGAGAKVADPNWKPLIVKVECSVVKRAARLPDAVQSVIPGDEGTGYSDLPRVQGAVYLRREERRSLGLPLTGAARINPITASEEAGLDPRWDWGPGWDAEGDDYWYPEWPY